MNISYLFKHVKIDDRTRDYIEKRLKSLEKVLKDILQIEIEIDMDKKGKFRVEVMACNPHKKYRSEETSGSIEEAVDIAERELREQIIKDTGKIKTLKQRGRMSLKKKMVLDEKSRF